MDGVLWAEHPNPVIKAVDVPGSGSWAEAIVYFRWRTWAFGAEEYWYGILDHDAFQEEGTVKCKTGKELQAISDIIVDQSSI